MPCNMWVLPRPGLEPVSPASAGGFLTTAPPGKSPGVHWTTREVPAWLILSLAVRFSTSPALSLCCGGLQLGCCWGRRAVRYPKAHGAPRVRQVLLCAFSTRINSFGLRRSSQEELILVPSPQRRRLRHQCACGLSKITACKAYG